VDVVEFRPTPDQFAWTFGGVAPTHRITPGTALRLWTEDAFSGQVRKDGDRRDMIAKPYPNPQSGPILVKGAKKGRQGR